VASWSDTVHESVDDRPFTPIFALPYWGEIGPFVRAAVEDAAASLDRNERDLFDSATPLVLWCWQSRGMPLQRERIFRRSVIDEFVHLGLTSLSTGSAATHRSTLWRMTEALNPDDGTRSGFLIPRSNPLVPYLNAEIAELHSWARTQSTEQRRQDATALLALGLGAGLATRELLAVEAGDVHVKDTRMGVTVWCDRVRDVPLLDPWHSAMRNLLESRSNTEWLFRRNRRGTSAGQVTNFLTRSRTPLDIRPARMRTTWLVHHLMIGTPPLELLRISGLRNFAALDKIAQFVPAQKKSSEYFVDPDQGFL
jgi:hypothetical protein